MILNQARTVTRKKKIHLKRMIRKKRNLIPRITNNFSKAGIYIRNKKYHYFLFVNTSLM